MISEKALNLRSRGSTVAKNFLKIGLILFKYKRKSPDIFFILK
jgi:hypothetical protein